METSTTSFVEFISYSSVTDIDFQKEFLNASTDLPAVLASSRPEWLKIIKAVYLFCITSIGVPGNLLIILVLWRNKEKSSTDYFVLTMAIVELVCSGSSTSLQILFEMFWVHVRSTVFCSLLAYSNTITSLSSTLLLGIIAIDRYLKACRPLASYISKTRAKTICICILVTAVFGGSPHSFVYQVCGKRCCLVNSSLDWIRIWETVVVVMILMVFGIISLSYGRICYVLRKRHHTRKKARMEQITANVITQQTAEGGNNDYTAEKYIDASKEIPGGRKIDMKDLANIDTTSEHATFNKSTDELTDREMPGENIAGLISDKNNVLCIRFTDDQRGVDDKLSNNFEQLNFTESMNDGSKQNDQTEQSPNTFVHKSDKKEIEKDLKVKTKDETAVVVNFNDTTCKEYSKENTPCTEKVQHMYNGDKNEDITNTHQRSVIQKINVKHQAINRMTKVLFLISFTYMVSWSAACFMVLGRYIFGDIGVAFGYTLNMLNCIANPIFFMTMSSRFRKGAMAVVCSRQ